MKTSARGCERLRRNGRPVVDILGLDGAECVVLHLSAEDIKRWIRKRKNNRYACVADDCGNVKDAHVGDWWREKACKA